MDTRVRTAGTQSYLPRVRSLFEFPCYMGQLPFLLTHDQMDYLRIHRQGSAVRTMTPSGLCTHSSSIVQSQVRESLQGSQGSWLATPPSSRVFRYPPAHTHLSDLLAQWRLASPAAFPDYPCR